MVKESAFTGISAIGVATCFLLAYRAMLAYGEDCRGIRAFAMIFGSPLCSVTKFSWLHYILVAGQWASITTLYAGGDVPLMQCLAMAWLAMHYAGISIAVWRCHVDFVGRDQPVRFPIVASVVYFVVNSVIWDSMC